MGSRKTSQMVCEKGQKETRPCLMHEMTPGEPISAVSMAMRDQLCLGTVGVLLGTG